MGLEENSFELTTKAFDRRDNINTIVLNLQLKLKLLSKEEDVV